MLHPEVTTSIFLDSRRKKLDGTYPVKLRITFNREQKYYALKFSFSEEDFLKIKSANPRGKLKEIQMVLNSIEEKAVEAIESMDEFSFKEFEDVFFLQKKKAKGNKDMYTAFDNYIETLRLNEQIRTADLYNLSKKSLMEFSAGKKLEYNQIDANFLNEYEKWMLKRGRSYTTIGIYARCIRKLLNDAMETGSLKRENYPFGKNRYKTPASRNIKKALSLDEIEKIFTYETMPGTTIQFAKDIWVFSYLCNGMNMNDVFKLRYSNLKDDTIIFYREKIKNTTKGNRKPIIVVITPEVREIIDRWKNPDQKNENYLFPVLNDSMSGERIRDTILGKTKTINKYIKRIAKNLGIEKEVTTNVARHSFSTVLKLAGASIEFIGESVGHHEKRTTEIYLDGFDMGTKKKFAASLTNFKKDKEKIDE